MRSAGLVDVTEAGSALLYSLNREHVVADAALALVDLRGRLFSRIREAISIWPVQPIAAAVFGSAARGDGNVDSDVDLFLIRPDLGPSEEPEWDASVDELSSCIRRWSGNHASIVQATAADVLAMVNSKARIVEDLRRDAIPVTDAVVIDLVDGGHR
ncbi:MAG: nucleotidyltransferase domain-containing protein [Dermatophilaceae bacterium]